MIRYLKEQKLLILETEQTSYWIGLKYPAPICLYWGAKIAPEDADMFEPYATTALLTWSCGGNGWNIPCSTEERLKVYR